MGLTTPCSLKTFLGISEDDNSKLPLFESLITSVSEIIENYCGRIFGLYEYTEFVRGTGTQLITLSQRPVLTIESLYLDPQAYWGDAPDAFAETTLKTQGVDFALQRDQPDGSSMSAIVYRINDIWPKPVGRTTPFGGQATLATVPLSRVGNIKVTYTAGYSEVPGPVKVATEMAIARIWKSGRFGAAVQSEDTPGYRYSLAIGNANDILDGVKPMLARFKDPVF